MSYKVKSAEGEEILVVAYKPKGKKSGKRKSSKQLKGWEHALDESAKAVQNFSSDYRKRHRKSHDKKRDGWFRDLDDNVYKSVRSSVRKAKFDRILGF